MERRFLAVRGLVLGYLCLVAGAVWLWSPAVSEGVLTVRFLDVGQGDAIHIVSPDGFEMLIDGGPDASVLRELASGRSFFDRDVDIVVATHPDTDHVSGLVDVLARYDVDFIFETEVDHDAPAAVAFDGAAGTEGARRVVAQTGQAIQLGASTTVRILSPLGDTANWRSNAASIIVQVIYGDIEFMLTGDAPNTVEDYLVGEFGQSLESDVLKLGHHGSDTSSSALFLATVNPSYAVVSAAFDNRYGHPHKEVIERTLASGAEMVSTAEEGTLTFKTDGVTVWLVE